MAKNTRKKGIGLKLLKPFMHGRYKRPEFIYLGGEPVADGSMILSNHAGTDAPISLEFYMGKSNLSFWGANEMTAGLIPMYKYQSRVYYHEKKHWNLFLSRLFCLLASPLTNIFYSGLDMIPTYHDCRLVKTLRESIETLKNGGNIVIFPEISDKGYLDVLEGFHGGCVSLADMCLRRGIDVPIYVSYFRKKDLKYIVDAPVRYSELCKDGATKDEIAARLCARCNELGQMAFEEKKEDERAVV